MFSNHNFVIISDFNSKKGQTKPLLSSGHSMPPMDEADCRTSQKKLIKKPKASWWLFAMLRYASGCTLYRWHSSVVGTNCFLFGRMRTHIFHRAPIIIFIASQSVFFPVIQSTLKGSEKILSTK